MTPEIQERQTVPGTVLVVDDDEAIRALQRATLEAGGHDVVTAGDAAEVRALLDSAEPPPLDAVVLDVMMPGESGLDLLVWLRTQRPQLPVILATASDSARDAVFALKNGAFDYLVKPVRGAELRLVVGNAVERSHMARELVARRALDGTVTRGAGGAVFASRAMRQVMGTLDTVKDARVPVMLLGPTGSGKEVVARTLHERSSRASRPFVAVNCAALPRDLADSELFGHEKGAFTGAQARRLGRFEEAQGGTLFLDEVGELDPAIQAKLLRVLQESELTRVGGGGAVRLDVRLVVATHRDVRAMVTAGTFREDLYYRLNVIVLQLPPLRERKDEIPQLAAALMARFATQEGVPVRTLTAEALQRLQLHDWPGNVRELDNTLKRSVLLCPHTELNAQDIQWEPGVEPPLTPPATPVPGGLGPAPFGVPRTGGGGDGAARARGEPEPERMMRALAETRGNVTEAARLLGIGRATFYRWASRHRIPL